MKNARRKEKSHQTAVAKEREQSSEKTEWLGVIAIATAIVVATFACYARVATHQFVNLDDPKYFYENSMVAAGLTSKGIAWAFTTFFFGNWHPLTWISNMIDVQIFGMNAGPILMINLLLHILNTLLVFAIFRRMALPLLRSGMVAALFALHPMHVESVAWASERKDVLSAFFALLCLFSYVRYAKSAKTTGLKFVPVAIFLALSLMTKSMFVTWPFVMLLLDYWPLQRLQIRGGERFRQWLPRVGELAREKLSLFALIAASSILSYFAQREGGAITGFERSPLSLRVANALVSYIKYIALLIWPKDLSVFYPYPPVPAWQALGALVILASITVLAVRFMRSHQYLIVGWAWFVGTLIPVIGLVKIGSQSMADRYSYTPSIGLFLVFVWGVSELADHFRLQLVAVRAAAFLWLMPLIILAFFQVGYWKDSVTLYKHALAAGTPTVMAHHNLGSALAMQRNWDEAFIHFKEVVRIDPRFRDAWLNIGWLLNEQGKFDEATTYLFKALEIDPASSKVHFLLANSFVGKGDPNLALPHFRRAIELEPANLDARSKLATMLLNMRKFPEAQEQFTEILRVMPDSAEAHNSLGVALLMGGKLDNATEEFSEALRLKPDFAGAQQNLNAVRKLQGKPNP